MWGVILLKYLSISLSGHYSESKTQEAGREELSGALSTDYYHLVFSATLSPTELPGKPGPKLSVSYQSAWPLKEKWVGMDKSISPWHWNL